MADERAGGAFVEMFLKDGKFLKGLDTLESKTRRWGTRMQSIGTNVAGLGLAGAAAMAPAVATFVSFEDAMAKVAAVSGATEDEFTSLRDKAKELGATTSFSATEAANAMAFLAMAGFDTQQVLAGIGPTLNLARSGSLELAEASDIASNVLSGFGLEVSEFTRLTDVMAKTQASANTNVQQLGEAMKFVAPNAKAVGSTVEETAAALGILGNNGVQASIAGTSLRRIFIQLADTKVQETLKEIGVNVLDATGNVRPLVPLMEDLQRALADRTGPQQLAFLTDQFTIYGATAAQILMGSTGQFQELITTLEQSSGAADQMAQRLDDNLGGKLRVLKSTVESVAISVSEGLEPSLGDLVEKATKAAGEFAKWAEENPELISQIAQLTTGATLLGGSLAVTGTVLRGASDTMVVLSNVMQAASKNAGKTGIALGTVAAALVADRIIGYTAALNDLNDSLQLTGRLSSQIAAFEDKQQAETISRARQIEDPNARREFIAGRLEEARARARLSGGASTAQETENQRVRDSFRLRPPGTEFFFDEDASREESAFEVRRRANRQEQYVEELEQLLEQTPRARRLPGNRVAELEREQAAREVQFANRSTNANNNPELQQALREFVSEAQTQSHQQDRAVRELLKQTRLLEDMPVLREGAD